MFTCFYEKKCVEYLKQEKSVHLGTKKNLRYRIREQFYTPFPHDCEKGAACPLYNQFQQESLLHFMESPFCNQTLSRLDDEEKRSGVTVGKTLQKVRRYTQNEC